MDHMTDIVIFAFFTTNPILKAPKQPGGIPQTVQDGQEGRTGAHSGAE